MSDRVYKIIIEANIVNVIDADGGYTEFTGNTALGDALEFIDQTEADS